MSETPAPTRRIGEIAAATGLTARTLRYYEDIGLVEPAERTASGHRLYGPMQVTRLYQVSMLKDVGMPLETVRESLDTSGGDLRGLMTEHLARVDEQLSLQHRLRSRLARMIGSLDAPEVGLDDLLELMEDMKMTQTTIDRHISLLVYEDIEAAYDWLQRVFGLGPGEITRHDGVPVHGELEAGDGVLWLHPESPDFNLSSPRNLEGSTATMAVIVDDVDAHHEFAAERGAEIRYQPVDQPYGYREYGAHDLEGHLWSFMKPLD